MRIAIAGVAGRMGRMLAAEVAATPGVELTAASERSGAAAVGQDLGRFLGGEPSGVLIVDRPLALFEVADVVLDFTTPQALPEHTYFAASRGKALVVGTTGLTEVHHQGLAGAAKRAPIVLSANYSIGVNLLLGLTRQVAAVLGDEYDVEIIEAHHRHKVDAPSGTALALGAAAAAGRGVQLDDVSARARYGAIGPRPKGAIGFAVIRAGDVVGEHTAMFAADGERLELTHKASSRMVFVKGAVRAALWTEGRAPGLYGMKDVLGLG